ncbi:MAG: carboxypeptidase regulatory-like domain-containing protein [Acidobacteria bacterium]|nr:carboxypeptidase regulatory-like domain-containing protein [Acidobacteriota bacterium]
MRKFTKLVIALAAIMIAQVAINAQNTGSIAGTVMDPNGAVVPGASVKAKNDRGQEFSTTTNDSGAYRIPSLSNGIYIVTVTGQGFKTATVSNVKVDIGTPTTVDAKLEIGNVGEVVEIASGGEVLQTQTAAVGTNITGRQITETPIASRDALDLILLLPGTANTGRPRSSSINGLPKGALSITLDGVDAQDNANRSTDGFFTYIRPRVDAIDEVTVSTANPGAESGGDGAVQIRFVTRRGTNDYTGGVFWQHRNTALNSNYWYNNRDGLPRQKIILNQYGGRIGGPIPFLGFGEGVGAFDSGKSKRFFFISHEEYRNPESVTRTRTILTPNAQAGIFSYIAGGVTNTVNLYTLAAANAQLATPDPTVAAALNRIRAAVATTGTSAAITNNPNRNTYSFTPSGLSQRNFTAVRLDFVLTKNHSFEFVYNRNNFKPGKDFLNSRDEIFPGFPFQGQSGIRKSYTGALRSTFGNNVVNEVRYANSGGTTDFFSELDTSVFGFTGGRFLDIGGAMAITNPYNGNSSQTRSTPTHDFTDSVTWVKGNHAFNFGGQYKFIRTEQTNVNRIVPTVSFGVNSAEGTAFTMFNATTMPGSTTTQQADARAIYAALIGRVSGYASNAYLDGSGRYVENGPLAQEFGLKTYGLFVQDSWRIRPNFSINYGIRWQPQEAFYAATGNIGRLEDWTQVYGISGPNGVFQPGASGGTAPRAVLFGIGEKAYEDDMDNFAPSVGVVWSPKFKGFLGTLFGGEGKSVFRGGFSRAFVREGSATQTIVTNNTPGGSIPLTRNTGVAGSFTIGTNLRDPGNTNLTTPTFSATPAFPLTLTTASQAIGVSPDLKTGTVDSFSFGYQREIDRNTVVEFRYVGNRGKGLHRLNFVNEVNTIENGFGAEFRLAQANLYANIAAGRGTTFAYFGAGTGTSPLPIMLSYFNTTANYDPSNPARYAATNFANATLVSLLNVNNPSPINFVGSASFENDATRRANAIANGRPSNFFRANPAVPAGSFLLQSDANSWYDSGVIEVRRRLSQGFRMQASYVFSKAQSDASTSAGGGQSNYTLRPGGLELAKNVQPFDIRHQFKFDATYDLPMGTGRAFFGNAGRAVNAIIGNWTLLPTVRWQSGSPFSFGNVNLVGMTKKELQESISVRKNATTVTFLPDDIILNTQRAFDLNITGAGGYGTTYGGAPTGRYIAPAGIGNCQQQYSGQCGFQNLIVYGPSFRNFDLAIAKKITISERRNFEIRTTLLDVFNSPSFRVGGWATDVATSAVGGTTFGQLAAGSAYQDLSTTNNPGGRLIDLMIRFNF